uniref:EGF-like domain-containing protein n=1 Tax=Polytomella parva TaxID=51329 RepID=A0A7S0VHX0_9CHLO|mmetsp:Transcript_4745/g.8608  ORF Transcript_4745/g.8608 Transcript_4745/m.8608 type:complete len:935 (+) Transcript_4745:177-2981(+)|eukprot:CAMPEP_0175079604 /NCGR_PEP_ID=MMETSP0052_2-20121109/24919_1 /TAXON_ID=51329 ORGANISM="Polytomella parva, Strain SAG 63-3" /NCGR_SAMPLE_ID=MMETSP0052_2 /ASSEMBLY_ACC=CAM_ASM_000194 /LENGTH=934 /DNA_ID=CAMNT_0016349961 /DNA_START=54 /DNA_END=2858 /DNA_ORIENTATION=+
MSLIFKPSFHHAPRPVRPFFFSLFFFLSFFNFFIFFFFFFFFSISNASFALASSGGALDHPLPPVESFTAEDGVHYVRSSSGFFHPLTSSQRELREAVESGVPGAYISDFEFASLLDRPKELFDPVFLQTHALDSNSDDLDPELSSPSSSSPRYRHLSSIFQRTTVTAAVIQRQRTAFDNEKENFYALPRIPKTHCESNGLLHPSALDCFGFYRQPAAIRIPPPRSNLPCPLNCSGAGVCDHDTGRCRCPAGFGGSGCEAPRKRPCFKMGPDKRDTDTVSDPRWSHSRCSGICDDDLAMCYCPPETKMGRIEAAADAPPGTPPVRQGRPMFWCHLKEDRDGNKVGYGVMPYNSLFGVDGWCNALQPNISNICPCRLDGLDGMFCEIVTEQTCPNQCSGRGECNLGFCKCYDGYYGHDCASRRLGHRLTLDDSVDKKPYLKSVMESPQAAEDPPLSEFRARPLIYVYDLPPRYGSDMLQYRIESGSCVYRRFNGHHNESRFTGHNYMLETAFHEMLLTSTHRTLDPEEADFFFVPAYAACLFSLTGNNDVPGFPEGIVGSRVFASSILQLEAKRWIQNNLPYWNRTGGRDHIWLDLHDEGACYSHAELWPSIHLSHWGRRDMPHVSNTNYHPDNYSNEQAYPDHGWPRGKWLRETSQAHPCYDPEKDLTIPAFFPAHKHWSSPFLGFLGDDENDAKAGQVVAAAARRRRPNLLVFRGNLGLNFDDPKCHYSRCIRQRLYNVSLKQEWVKHKAFYGPASNSLGDYSQMLASATFSLVLPGDGWSYRLEDSILHGSIPVIIMDDVDVVFQSVLDFDRIGIRILEKDLDQVLERVQTTPSEKIQEMQDNIAAIWHRFRYNRPKMQLDETKRLTKRFHTKGRNILVPGLKMAETQLDDAFDTIMQWLYTRIPKIHGSYDEKGVRVSPYKKWFQVANLYL